MANVDKEPNIIMGKSSLPSDLLVGVFILTLTLATLPDHSQMYSFTEQPAIEG